MSTTRLWPLCAVATTASGVRIRLLAGMMDGSKHCGLVPTNGTRDKKIQLPECLESVALKGDEAGEQNREEASMSRYHTGAHICTLVR